MITPPQGSDPSSAIESVVSPAPSAVTNNYRCPACGELVNAASPQEILLHHEHVTHPDHFNFTKHAA